MSQVVAAPQQATEEQVAQATYSLMVAVIRQVKKRYILVSDRNTELQAVRDAAAPFREEAKPFREKLKGFSAEWKKLTPQSPAADFKRIAVDMAGQKTTIGDVNKRAADATKAHRETAANYAAQIKALDATIPQMLQDKLLQGIAG